jgi:hypothetical protein
MNCGDKASPWWSKRHLGPILEKSGGRLQRARHRLSSSLSPSLLHITSSYDAFANSWGC